MKYCSEIFINELWPFNKKKPFNNEDDDNYLEVPFFNYKIWVCYPKEYSNNLSFINSKVRIAQRNYNKMINILLTEYKKLNSEFKEYFDTIESFRQHLIPTDLQIFKGTRYGGFVFYIGDDFLFKQMGGHVFRFEFDSNDKMSNTFGTEG